MGKVPNFPQKRKPTSQLRECATSTHNVNVWLAMRVAAKAAMTMTLAMFCLPAWAGASVGPSPKVLVINPQIIATEGSELRQINWQKSNIVAGIFYTNFVNEPCLMVRRTSVKAINQASVDHEGSHALGSDLQPRLFRVGSNVSMLHPFFARRNGSSTGSAYCIHCMGCRFAHFAKVLPNTVKPELWSDNYYGVCDWCKDWDTTRVLDNQCKMRGNVGTPDLQRTDIDNWRYPGTNLREHLLFSDVSLAFGLRGLFVGLFNGAFTGFRGLPASIERVGSDDTSGDSGTKGDKGYKSAYAINPVLNSPMTALGAAVLFLAGGYGAFYGLRSDRGWLFAVCLIGAGCGAGLGLRNPLISITAV